MEKKYNKHKNDSVQQTHLILIFILIYICLQH